jgi:hypothetical protein
VSVVNAKFHEVTSTGSVVITEKTIHATTEKE